MAFDPDLLELMGSTFTYTPSSAEDGFGKEVTGTPVPGVVCHVTYATKIVRGDHEENVTSNAQIQCPPIGYAVGSVTTPHLTMGDLITLGDGVQRRILQVKSFTDEDGDASPWHQSAMLT